MGPDRKLAEEEDLFGSAHPEEEEEEEQEQEEEEEEEEGDLDLASESTRAQWSEADTLLAVVKREPVEQAGEGARTDCEPVGLEKPVEQSSAASELPEASSQELAEAPAEAPSPEPRDSKEDVKKFEFDACNEVPPAPKESSTSEGADQKMSSFKEEKDIKPVIKDEKGTAEPLRPAGATHLELCWEAGRRCSPFTRQSQSCVVVSWNLPQWFLESRVVRVGGICILCFRPACQFRDSDSRIPAGTPLPTQ